MNEHLKALLFYRRMMDALKTPGISSVTITLANDGEINADAKFDCKD